MTIKKIEERLNNLQSLHDTEIENINNELMTARNDLQTATELMRTTNDPEIFRKAKDTIESKKADVEFWERQSRRVNAILSNDEYKDLKDELLIEYESVTANGAKNINKALTELLNAYKKVSDDIEYLSLLLEKAGDLANVDYHMRKHLYSRDIKNLSDDFWFKNMSEFYFQKSGQLEQLRNAGVKV